MTRLLVPLAPLTFAAVLAWNAAADHRPVESNALGVPLIAPAGCQGGAARHSHYGNPEDGLGRIVNRRVCSHEMSLMKATHLINTHGAAGYRRHAP